MVSKAPQFSIQGDLEVSALSRALPDVVGAIDPEYLRRQRWFGSKGKPISALRLKEHAVVQATLPFFFLNLIEVEYAGFDTELYFVPLMISNQALPRNDLLLQVQSTSAIGFVYEALGDDEFCTALLQRIERPGQLRAIAGDFVFDKTPAFLASERFTIKRSRAEQSNTSIIFGDALILKAFRKVEMGINPDLEICHFLTTRTTFPHIPRVAGSIEYQSSHSRAAIGILQHFIRNEGDAWDYTLRHLQRFYASVAQAAETGTTVVDPEALEGPAGRLLREYAADADRLGHTTGQLHLALASDRHDPSFAPEPITRQDATEWVASIKQHIEGVLGAIHRNVSSYDPALQKTVADVLRKKPDYLKKVEDLQELGDVKISKIRCHGDYHLGQVLKTEEGFCILDFEGEPLRSLESRRHKTSPLKDVAGMLRSYSYAAHAGLRALDPAGEHQRAYLESWAHTWERMASRSFLAGYLDETRRAQADFVPASHDLLHRILSVFVLDKAIYELGYELSHRPTWVSLPLEGLQAAMLGGRDVD